jgi:hypothetical protein
MSITVSEFFTKMKFIIIPRNMSVFCNNIPEYTPLKQFKASEYFTIYFMYEKIFHLLLTLSFRNFIYL